MSNSGSNNNKAVIFPDHDAASNEISGYTLDDLAFIPSTSRHNRLWSAKTGDRLLLGAEIAVFSTPVPTLVLRPIQPPV
jgi:hypothetical protein